MRTRIALVAVGLLTTGLATATEPNADVTPSRPQDVVLGFYRDVFNNHDVEAIDWYVTDTFVDHNPDPGQQPGMAGLKDAFKKLFTAFPDLHINPEQVLIDGQFVTVRGTLSGTQE